MKTLPFGYSYVLILIHLQKPVHEKRKN